MTRSAFSVNAMNALGEITLFSAVSSKNSRSRASSLLIAEASESIPGSPTA